MNKVNLQKRVISGLIWTFGEKVLAQGVSFIISIILARILLPSEYGIVTLVIVFINLANVFVTNGIGESLIQKKDANDKDYSTIFYFSFLLSIFLYIVLYVSAPLIAQFYNNLELIWILRILALQIPIASFNTVQQAYVSKKMMFKKFFFATLGGTIISGITGIILAFHDFGVWALVGQILINNIMNTIILFFVAKWRPKLLFSYKSLKELLGFGWKLLAANLINTSYSQLRTIIIGKVYTPTDLAYYDRGNQIPSILIANIDSTIGKVVFPAMAQVNTNISHLKNVTRRSLKTTSYLVFPLMTGLICIANPLTLILLTDKWIPSVPFLQIYCIYWLFQPMQTANWQAIKALGRSDLLLKLEIIKKIIGITLLLLTMRISIYAIAISTAFFACISMIINMVPNKKLLDYSIIEQLRDLLPSILTSVIMGVSIYFIPLLSLSSVFVLLLQILIGSLVYLSISYVFKIESFFYLLNLLRNFKRTKA